MGLAPAATVFTPSRKMACASTVAVVVPSPATSEVLEATSRTICAPMFSSGSCSSISFATVTPSLVMIGAPNFFSITALRPFGPSVIFTASASALTPRRIAWREFSPVTICFAMCLLSSLGFFRMDGWPWRLLGRYSGSYFLPPAALAAPPIFARISSSFRIMYSSSSILMSLPQYFAEQDAIAHLHVERNQFALFVDCPRRRRSLRPLAVSLWPCRG